MPDENAPSTPNQTMHVVPGSVVRDILATRNAELIDLVQATYEAHPNGKTINPDSYFLRFPDQPRNRIIALPSSISDAEGSLSGISWIASFPGNIDTGLARASAVMVLNDAETGYPFAFMEAALISSNRTAASAVLGARQCSPNGKKIDRLSVVGAGIIARTTIDMFFADGWEIDEVNIFDLDEKSADALCDYINSKQSCPARKADTLTEATKGEIVLFVTSAGEPYVTDLDAFQSGQVVLNISLRDIGPEIILKSYNIFDDVEHCMKASTSPHLAEQLTGNRDFVTGTIADVSTGRVNLKHDKPIIYSPFGLGVLDLVLAREIYQEALDKGTAIAIPNFFGETARW
jgi:2,3-diaminopropionate biosynthesis protein SbnB